eukprot:TRINITY_DN15525_c0_g1_i1.p1 TRINITY_DN15525_c0_g1~~TRINITY_DN15525_c0_g1_i1.p1  ORF type:complete len:141 (+),score=27.31 TRINITY_DN15525_c0_g1_i1:60-425(+)
MCIRDRFMRASIASSSPNRRVSSPSISLFAKTLAAFQDTALYTNLTKFKDVIGRKFRQHEEDDGSKKPNFIVNGKGFRVSTRTSFVQCVCLLFQYAKESLIFLGDSNGFRILLVRLSLIHI